MIREIHEDIRGQRLASLYGPRAFVFLTWTSQLGGTPVRVAIEARLLRKGHDHGERRICLCAKADRGSTAP